MMKNIKVSSFIFIFILLFTTHCKVSKETYCPAYTPIQFKIKFPLNTYDLDAEQAREFDIVIMVINSNEYNIEVSGHTASNEEGLDTKKNLSELRVNSVINYMKRNGLDTTRIKISTKNFGNQYPCDTINHILNSRVHILLIKKAKGIKTFADAYEQIGCFSDFDL